MRLNRLEQLLRRELPSWTWTRPAGGLSAWIELPEGNATTFAQVAQRHGVSVVAGPLLSADEGHQRHLRITYAAGLAAIAEGVVREATAVFKHANPAGLALDGTR